MKILCILTGGTIGSRISDGVINVDDNSPYLLLQKYNEQNPGGKTDFDVVTPLNMLSENLQPKNWKALYEAISDGLNKDYNGIIIAHGSDTLAYTAAFVGLCFGNVNIPVLLTASNYPLEDSRSIGLKNFSDCVDIIGEGKLIGTYVVYGNDRGQRQIYHATRLRPADYYRDQFASFDGNLVETMDAGRTNTTNTNGGREVFDEDIIKSVDFSFHNQVMLIAPYPGFRYDSIKLDTQIRAVLISAYHSGTVCTTGDEYSIYELISRCSSTISIYVCSYKDISSAQYITAAQIIKDGIHPLENISPEAAYVKLLLAYNQSAVEPIEFMSKNINHEIAERI